ncbi:MAG: BadF/BadG/BcrA/BcrD ATPase family protein [Pseudomonadota bacterium]
MARDIYIGVDGGGTKTKFRVEDSDGNLIDECRGGPAQIRVSVAQAWDSIYKGLHVVLPRNNLDLDDKSTDFHIGLGLAGTEFKDSCKDFLKRPHHFKTLSLESDGYAACLGAHDCENGSMIIIGTGTKGLQIEDGLVSEVAGFGFPQDDVGGGAWLGLQAVSIALRSFDGREKTSPFCEALIQRFDGIENLLNWSISATSTTYGTLAPLVVEYANKQDPHALQILNHAVAAIDEIGATLYKKQKDKSTPLPCCLFGGLVPFIKPLLSPALQQRLVERKYGPAKGAIFMVKNKQQAELKHN